METIKVKQYNTPRDNSVYEDVLSHCTRPNRGDGRYTDAHETSHFISSEIRNANTGHNNGFYLLNDIGVLLEHPKITIREAGGYIPRTLRGMRYQLYFVDQLRYWNEDPLYIVEELNCYTLGGMTALDDAKNNRSLERTDAVAGSFEFSIYTLGMIMCIQDKDKSYWDNNQNFREFMDFLLKRAFNTFYTGKEIPEFNSISQGKIYDAYLNTSDGKKFQEFYKKTFPEKPVDTKINWTIDTVF